MKLIAPIFYALVFALGTYFFFYFIGLPLLDLVLPDNVMVIVSWFAACLVGLSIGSTYWHSVFLASFQYKGCSSGCITWIVSLAAYGFFMYLIAFSPTIRLFFERWPLSGVPSEGTAIGVFAGAVASAIGQYFKDRAELGEILSQEMNADSDSNEPIG